MSLELYLNNQIVEPLGAFQLEQKLSGIDTLDFGFAMFEGFERVNYQVVLKEDNVQVFKGTIQTQTISQTMDDSMVRCVAFGELYKLESCLAHTEKNYSGSVVDLLNTNNQGIIFENYNLQSKDLFFNSEIKIKSYLQLLEEIRTKSSIQYYYDYQKNKCMLGVPTGAGTNSNDLIYADQENDKILKLPDIQVIDYSKISNRISISSGTQNSIGLEFATITEASYPKQERNDLIFPTQSYTCVENTVSIAKYGLKEEFLRGVNITSSSGDQLNKELISNYLYKVAVDKANTFSKPQIQLKNLEYKADTSYEVNLFNIFDLDYEILGQEVKGKYMIEAISHDLTQLENSGIHKAQIQLTNYIDRGFDKTRSYFDFIQSKASDQVSTGSQSIPISTTGTFSYSINSTFKTVEQYNIGLTFSNVGAFTVSSIKIDGYDLTQYFTPLNFIDSGSTNIFDITNSSLPISIKSQLELSGNHVLTINAPLNTSITGNITVLGYV
jgi:hypothetical protein